MSEHLSGNVSGGGDLETHGDHFKWGPVLVLYKVSDESVRVFTVRTRLTGWIGDTGTEGDELGHVLYKIDVRLGVRDNLYIKVLCNGFLGSQLII